MRPVATPVLLSLALALAGCTGAGIGEAVSDAAPDAAPEAPRMTAPPPPRTARTAEQFDTTTESERAAALAPAPPGGAERLGTTLASLGDPAEPGFWLETPLVTGTRQGRVMLAGTGTVVQVELRPISGPATGGSRISLAAMRLLGLSLTDIPELEVYAG